MSRRRRRSFRRSIQKRTRSFIQNCYHHVTNAVVYLSHCNYIACLWKVSASANLDIPTPSQYVWTSEYEIQWLDEIFQAYYEELVTYGHGKKNKSESESDDNYDVGSGEDSEDKDNNF